MNAVCSGPVHPQYKSLRQARGIRISGNTCTENFRSQLPGAVGYCGDAPAFAAAVFSGAPFFFVFDSAIGEHTALVES
ncbi:hypothetical protein PMI16_01921 [Herbaspirillum sp. CF444]|nr:hypothetical protein PMI16_01921 [Herbaspirillum sp. CF444]